jgi:acyl dehydratase
MTKYYEDYHVGDRFETEAREMTEEAILRFAVEFDPQTFHTDIEAARATPVGRLIASGWHTASTMMRLIVDSGFFKDTLGIGADELRWRRPVYPGDRLHVVGEVMDLRPSASKPVGTMRVKLTTRNQDGEEVMTMVSIVQPRRRP